MRIRPYKNFKVRSGLLICLCMVPFILVGVYAANIARLFNETVDFTYNPPNPSSFKVANYSRLNEMAEYYDARFEDFHIPLNFSTDTVFTDANCTDVSRYAYSDNGAQWTGLAITAFVYKYMAAGREGNAPLEQEALRVIRKLLHGMSMLLAVPNGGIGPEYSGILARGWAGPEHKDIAGFYFDDIHPDERHHNGTGQYANYRWRGYTSNDEYSGFYSGLAIVLKYVQVPDVQSLVALMVDQVASYMVSTNFLGIDWHGGPTGVDQKARFFQGGAWACLLLKMGAIVRPEKFEQLYYHCAAEKFYALWSKEGGEQESISNYYAYAFGYHVVFALLQLEDKAGPLHDLYWKKFDQSLWAYTRYHRNPFYNTIRLVLTYTPGENPILERDVEDQLMRYDCEYHFPDRAFGHATVSLEEYPPVKNVDELRDFLENDPHGFLYQPIFGEVQPEFTYLSRPLTVEFMEGNIFVWEKNPFQVNFNRDPYANPAHEYASYCFSTVYWMARAYGFVQSAGLRSGGSL